MRKRWLVILIFFSMFSMIIPFITPAHAEFQPSVAHLEDSPKIYMLYYDDNASRAVSVVETTILFRNEDPNTTTFFMLMPSSVMNDNGTNNTGWGTELALCYEDGTVFRNMGLVTTNESIGFYTLDTKKNYMLKTIVHMPENLTIGVNYTSVVKIGALPYNITPGTWAAAEVRSFDFTAKIIPTLDYYVFGKVYMSDGSPAEFATVKIKNKNTGGVTEGLTDLQGEYFVKITDIGYHDGDIIQVSAEKNDEKGTASTLVSIVPPFRQDFLGSQCDVHLKKTTGNIIEQVKYPLTAGIIIAVCIIGFFSAKKLREKEKEGRAERAKRKLMKLEERRKELEKEIEKEK